MPGGAPPPTFRFGEFAFHPRDGLLVGDGRTETLQPRVAQALELLLESPGRLVTREELIAALWGEAFIQEGALDQVISKVRRALGDDRDRPRFIETRFKRPAWTPAGEAPGLYKVPLEAGGARRLAAGGFRAVAAAPGGSGAAVLGSGPEGFGVYLVDLQSGRLRLLSRAASHASPPLWTRDGGADGAAIPLGADFNVTAVETIFSSDFETGNLADWAETVP